MNFPDPDEILQIVERIRDAFNRAADNSTGNAQRLFQRLNDKVDNLYTQATDPSRAGEDPQKQIMRLLPAVFEMQMLMSQIKREAERDPAVLQTLQTLSQDIQDETKMLLPLIAQILPGLPGLPKLPGMPDFGLPKKDAPKPQPQPPRNSNQAPKPPKKGGFK